MEYKIKHRILTLVFKILLGLFMLSSGIMMLVVNPEPGVALPGTEGKLAEWLMSVIATGYLWQWIAIFKVINGLLILIPRTSALGILAAFPYYLNIFLYTAFIAQIYFKLSIPAFVVTCYLIYAYWDRYRPIVSK
jgi:hypothetical protein